MEEYDLILPNGEYLSERLPGVSLASFVPESPNFESNTTYTHPLRNGIIKPKKGNRGRYTERKISIKLNISAYDSEHFHLIRGDLHRLFKRKDPFYISYTYQPNKRYLVSGDDSFTVAQDSYLTWKEQEITLTDILGLAESVYDTTTPFKIDQHWGFDMNVGVIANPMYRFKNLSKFEVYNLGDEDVSPIDHNYNVEMYLEGRDIEIINETTGESFTLVGSQSKTNKITLAKFYAVNGSTILTTKGACFPVLVPGANKFKIINATYSDIKFITHFYYK
ncbi:phage tail family protein [Bacillus subtilis subsp. subtilis]|uniref:phage tail domain-containing protein n=1 Tax=Bacillus subtilis TaxID=1423 RepID=UPI00129D6187|nr:phage tail domain-containing protein [Bacillus subtilis]NCT23829.1 phage tail family protein [Bacillus subtilis subsp. subtilis]QGI17723.1 phage tail family protein [Bacillus subtilis]CAF1889146.1 hypothetical protein NRS6183_03114 [Bacillus subtilis]CAI6274291.1 phage tail family protein [Bacillus subtilis]